MSNKQTSIEWLEYKTQNTKWIDLTLSERKEIIQQAKEMHKQEITKAFDEGQEYEYQYHINNTPKFDSETYYQETFVSKGSDSEIPNVCSSQTEVNETDNTPKEVKKDSFGEISDEEIYEGIIKHCSIPHDRLCAEINAMIGGAKWYREQLKQRQ
jgi:hypothetical protein